MRIYFNLNYNTKVGENVQLSVLEDNQEKIYPLYYSENGNWKGEVDYFSKSIIYQFQVVDDEGNILDEEIVHHHLTFFHNYSEYRIFDVWNLKNFPENYLNNKILKNNYQNFKPEKRSVLKKHTHLFRIEVPIYNPELQLVLIGNLEALGQWDYAKATSMLQTQIGIWEVALTLPNHQFVQYKYGLLDKKSGTILALEYGEDRWALPNNDKNVLQIQNDHYFRFHSDQLYRSAGVAIPVFSLRSENSFGVGEFSDLKLLANWTHQTQLKLIQVLPINDTTANYSWTDSYPYAGISVHALHPIYLSIDHLEFGLPKDILQDYKTKKEELNSFSLVDYEKVILNKWNYIQIIFEANKELILKDRNFKKFQKENEFWLYPYAAFCVQRDKYKTPNFNNWKTHKKYIAGKINPMFKPQHRDFSKVMLHCWVQYQLHLQLKDAVDYCHQLGVSIKGDLPIGIYRHSVEAWAEPELFGMDFQAGAPPDHFSRLGQNWEFPTYNWTTMKLDGYQWWKNRFASLEQYFDAMRIDHILGFFRIWRMPITATQAILGYFYPAIPITVEEFEERNIPFDEKRYCVPYINDDILFKYFGGEAEIIKAQFFIQNDNLTYTFKEKFNTQRKLKDYFEQHSLAEKESRLYELSANVLFLKEEKENGIVVYHPRFNHQETQSYQYLTDAEKHSISELYWDYFFVRQDDFWRNNALEKLPIILNATDMLICGEDLGMVPNSVPEVMDKLAITALKVQRMPPENQGWYDPKRASYTNVVTTSTHDSSTLRQWWQENRELTQDYFQYQLNQFGTAPFDLHPRLAEIILNQHLQTEAMLAIFPLQDFLATDENLRNNNLENERINRPEVFPHYWRYRMHISLEQLNEETEFNNKIASWIKESGRLN